MVVLYDYEGLGGKGYIQVECICDECINSTENCVNCEYGKIWKYNSKWIDLEVNETEFITDSMIIEEELKIQEKLEG